MVTKINPYLNWQERSFSVGENGNILYEFVDAKHGNFSIEYYFTDRCVMIAYNPLSGQQKTSNLSKIIEKSENYLVTYDYLLDEFYVITPQFLYSFDNNFSLKGKKTLNSVNNIISATAKNGVLYIATLSTVYSMQNGNFLMNFSLASTDGNITKIAMSERGLVIGTKAKGTEMLLGKILLLSTEKDSFMKFIGKAAVSDDQGYPLGWVCDIVTSLFSNLAIVSVVFSAQILDSTPSILALIDLAQI